MRSKESRCELDASSDHIKAKISSAEQMKVHTMLVIGHRDPAAAGPMLSAFAYTTKGNLGEKPRAEVVADLLPAISARSASDSNAVVLLFSYQQAVAVAVAPV